MKRMRGFWFLAALVILVAAGVVYLQANAQTVPVQQPVITEALVDVENAALTINGYDFPAGVPTVTLGMTALAVVSAKESAVMAGLPELRPGTYLLAVTWIDGAGTVFYLTVGTVGTVGPAGPQGPQGDSAPLLASALEYPSTSEAGYGAAADNGDPPTTQDHAGNTNTHFGQSALASVTTGAGNTAVGQEALRLLTTGIDNAGFGRLALRGLTTGRGNLAIGTSSMLRATDASFNVAIGSSALTNTLSGQHNVAIGAGTLQYTLGDQNVAIGSGSLLVSLGDQNIAIGRSALRRNTSGSGNIAVGYQAGIRNQTGSNNVYIGSVGANGDEGIIRIGTEGVHNRIYLAGEIEGNIVAVYQ